MPAADRVASVRAVYDASADRYVAFAGTEVGDATEAPLDRSVLAAFAELLGRPGPGATVADVGCGPGRVGALLAAHGLRVVGVDLSSAMLVEAHRAHPQLALAGGRLDALPIATGALAGAVGWYSIIHTPPAGLDRCFAELGRVLVDGGRLLLAFQVGEGEAVHRADAHGTGLSLTSYRHGLTDVAGRLDRAGFEVDATVVRRAELVHEVTPQAFVLATVRPTAPAVGDRRH